MQANCIQLKAVVAVVIIIINSLADVMSNRADK